MRSGGLAPLLLCIRLPKGNPSQPSGLSPAAELRGKRMMGVEPTTAILEGWHSAIELHPQYSVFSSGSGSRTHTWLILSQLTLPLVYPAIRDLFFKHLADGIIDRDVALMSVKRNPRQSLIVKI